MQEQPGHDTRRERDECNCIRDNTSVSGHNAALMMMYSDINVVPSLTLLLLTHQHCSQVIVDHDLDSGDELIR